MTRTHLLAFAALLTFVAVSLWMAQRFATAESPAIDTPDDAATGQPIPLLSSAEADLASLEAAALQSCLCARDGGDPSACEKIYDEARDALVERVYGNRTVATEGPMATACAPVSSESECFEFTDGTRCVDLGFYVTVASAESATTTVCTVQEAQAVEQAYQQGWLGSDGVEPDSKNEEEWSAANDRANEAVNEVLRRIMAGEKFAAASTDGGCTS